MRGGGARGGVCRAEERRAGARATPHEQGRVRGARGAVAAVGVDVDYVRFIGARVRCEGVARAAAYAERKSGARGLARPRMSKDGFAGLEALWPPWVWT